MTAGSAYQRGWRRMLVDMEIPAWDERFLSEYDPIAMADLYARAGLSAVMLSCKNLSGLCFWPTTVGEMHPGLRGRDVIGETVDALAERGIAACAYFAAIFDNWPAERHPDWRVELAQAPRPEPSPWDRHGLCCPSHPGYREYIAAQIADLYGRYDFGCAFCDMTFWPGVCACRHCRERFGADIPDTIDWTSPAWCAFQSAREEWIADFHGHVTAAMRAARPGIAVYHNFAPAPASWRLGLGFDVTEHSDFLGGDLYGDAVEQLVVTKLMRNLSRSRPAEYMTFCTTGTEEHVRLKRPQPMRSQVLAATAESTAFMFIDAIDPVGTANPRTYDRVREAFEASVPFERHLGGEAVEDVAVYFSGDSKMDLAENGRAVRDAGSILSGHPHLDALRGACRILAGAHIPFGVITRRQLAELDRHRVLVLPNVLRMDAEEVAAVREYVRGGGRVYASGHTSLLETRGVRHDDFMLADVLGVHLAREEPTGMVYARPATEGWLEPQRYLSANPSTLLRLRAEPDARVLATLTLPYAHPHMGHVSDQRWASIHSWPPWEDTDTPAIVRRGGVVYSAFDIEREDADVNDRLFARLIDDLLGDDWSLRCDADPAVWVSAFREGSTIRVALLNAGTATLRLRPPHGARFVALEEVPAGRAVPFETEADGTLRCTVALASELTMLRARHEGP